MLLDAVYVDPQNVRVDIPSNQEGEEFEDEGDEHVEEEKTKKREWTDKSAVVSKKYEVIGTILNREVLSFSFLFSFNFKFN